MKDLSLRGQLEKERAKIKRQMSRLLMYYDGDMGVARYLHLTSDEWVESAEGVRQNLCSLSTIQTKVSISNVVMAPNSSIPDHSHDNHETIFVVDGQIFERHSGKHLHAGEAMSIAEGVRHGLESEEGALLTLTWRPALETECPEIEGDCPGNSI